MNAKGKKIVNQVKRREITSPNSPKCVQVCGDPERLIKGNRKKKKKAKTTPRKGLKQTNRRNPLSQSPEECSPRERARD